MSNDPVGEWWKALMRQERIDDALLIGFIVFMIVMIIWDVW